MRELKLNETGGWLLIQSSDENAKCSRCGKDGEYYCKEKNMIYCNKCNMAVMESHTRFFADDYGQHEHFCVEIIDG